MLGHKFIDMEVDENDCKLRLENDNYFVMDKILKKMECSKCGVVLKYCKRCGIVKCECGEG